VGDARAADEEDRVVLDIGGRCPTGK